METNNKNSWKDFKFSISERKITILILVLCLLLTIILSIKYNINQTNKRFLFGILVLLISLPVSILPFNSNKRVFTVFIYQLKAVPRQLKSLIKSNAIIFALVLLYVFFYHFWETWIANHIIDPFLSHFESNLLNDIIFIIASTICFVLIFLGKRIKQKTLILSIIAMAIWAYYRFHFSGLCGVNDSPYYLYFKPLSTNNTIKYFDILFIIAICAYCSYFIWKHKMNWLSSPIFNQDKGLTRNLPIDNKQHDLLERDKIATSVVRDLLLTDTSKGSFTYGIDAPWGSGKTSFINLMKNHFNSDDKPKIIIDFNPWLYAAKKDLVTAFFDELSKTLKIYDTSLSKNLIDYSKLLSALGTTETKMISSLLELTHEDNSSLQEKKQQITEAIKTIKRRIIVFIDDLDRLETDEILEMMKLIRNVSDFPYMYIIAAYDKNYVVKCLSTKMKSSATNFIEKIFEHEDILAPSSNESLRRALDDEIKRKTDIENLTDYIMNHENKPLNAISNLREVYRLSNSIASTYNFTNLGIHNIDLLLFELFKTKYPIAFSSFEHKWHEVLVQDAQHQYYRLFKGKDYDGYFDFIQYLKRNHEEMCLNEFDIKTIKMILSDLFESKDDEEDRTYRINSIKWFNRYMNLTQLKSDIPETEFNEVMKETIEVIKKQIDDWSINKYVSLRHRLLNYDKDEKCNREELISNIDSFLYASIKNKWENYDELTKMISRLKRFSENEVLTEKNRIAILDLLMNNSYNDFLVNYIGYLYKEKKWTDILLSLDDLITVQESVFKKCCETYSNDFSSVLSRFATLLGKDSYHIEESDTIFKIHDPYIKKLASAMQEFAETHILDFLREMFYTKYNSPVLEDKIAINPITKLIWGSWENFKVFLTGLDKEGSNQEIKKFKQLFSQFENNHYKPVLKFIPIWKWTYYADKT